MEKVSKAHLESLTERLCLRRHWRTLACSFVMEFEGTGGVET